MCCKCKNTCKQLVLHTTIVAQDTNMDAQHNKQTEHEATAGEENTHPKDDKMDEDVLGMLIPFYTQIIALSPDSNFYFLCCSLCTNTVV